MLRVKVVCVCGWGGDCLGREHCGHGSGLPQHPHCSQLSQGVLEPQNPPSVSGPALPHGHAMAGLSAADGSGCLGGVQGRQGLCFWALPSFSWQEPPTLAPASSCISTPPTPQTPHCPIFRHLKGLLVVGGTFLTGAWHFLAIIGSSWCPLES